MLFIIVYFQLLSIATSLTAGPCFQPSKPGWADVWEARVVVVPEVCGDLLWLGNGDDMVLLSPYFCATTSHQPPRKVVHYIEACC